MQEFRILNWMVQFDSRALDHSFSALADATRRGVITQLAVGEASVTVLAERFNMTVTGMKKHVAVLERVGLVATEKIGRTRVCRLGPHGLAAEARFIEQVRASFEARFSALDRVLDGLKQEDEDGRAGS